MGCFYQPSLVLCDPLTQQTLPEEEYRCGCAEVIKYAVLGSEAFFRELWETLVSRQREHVIETCVKMKRDIVREDEFDRGQRQLLNLGHSFGHGVEACSGFSVLHGQAVAIGLAIITRAAAAKGICTAETCRRILAMLERYQLPTQCEYSLEDMMQAVFADKKISGDTIRLVIPEAIGRCRIQPVPLSEVREWMALGGVR